jgi:hypothetical protein
MQTTKGVPAKGCTKMEWVDVMTRIKAAIAEKLRALPAAGDGSFGGVARYSFDNDKIHQDIAAQAQLKVGGSKRVPLPPYSHDIHRVVEHTLGRLKTAFNKWLYSHPAALSMAQYMAALEHIFFTTQTPAIIAADVATLPSVYRAIQEAKGNWPDRVYM